MLNAKEYFNQLDTTLALEELDDEVAATCSGGATTSAGSSPESQVELWQDGPFNKKGEVLSLYGFQKNDGISNLGYFNFNDQTSSIRIREGKWAFYKDDQYRTLLATLGPG